MKRNDLEFLLQTNGKKTRDRKRRYRVRQVGKGIRHKNFNTLNTTHDFQTVACIICTDYRSHKSHLHVNNPLLGISTTVFQCVI